MKRIVLLFLLCALNFTTAFTQNQVVISFDNVAVPLSVQQNMQKLLQNILLSTYRAQDHPVWRWDYADHAQLNAIRQGYQQPLLQTKDSLSLLFLLATKDSVGYRSQQIDKPIVELDSLLQYGRFSASNTNAYQKLRLPQVLGNLYQRQVSQCYLIDIYQPYPSQRRTYTPQEDSLITYYTRDSIVQIKNLAQVSYAPSPNLIRVVFREVKFVKTNSKPLPTFVPEGKITILTPKGTRRNPQEATQISWSCSGCADTTEFTVIINSIEGKKSKIRQKTKSSSFTIPEGALEKGKYRVRVQAAGMHASRHVYMQYNVVSGGGGSAFLILLLLAGLGTGGYALWRRQQAAGFDDDDDD